MKRFLAIAICSLPFALAPAVYAQTTNAGSSATTGSSSTHTNDGVTRSTDTAGTSVSSAVASSESGQSVKNDIIGKTVYNETNDKVGNIKDVIVSPDGKVMSFIVGAGGFLGLDEHDLAIPFQKITKNNDKLMMAGYTKDQLKALPTYKSTKSDFISRMTHIPTAPGAPKTSTPE